MFDGKTFLPTTGIPIRKMACMSKPFAEADPVPLTVPILSVKSFMPLMLVSARFLAGAALRGPADVIGSGCVDWLTLLARAKREFRGVTGKRGGCGRDRLVYSVVVVNQKKLTN